MRALSLKIAIVAILFFSNFLFAGSPEKYATKTVSKIDSEVKLTANQKVLIKRKAMEFGERLQEANTISDKKEAMYYIEYYSNEYNAGLDSILTADQISKRENKKNERVQTNITKHTTKK